MSTTPNLCQNLSLNAILLYCIHAHVHVLNSSDILLIQSKYTINVVVASQVWSNKSIPDPSDLIKIHDQIEKLEQNCGYGSTIFTCM